MNTKNSTQKNITRKPRISRHKQIEEAQKEWKRQAEQLALQKAHLGYKDFPIDAFLQVDPSTINDLEKQSQIIELQGKITAHQELEKILWVEDEAINELNKKHAIARLDQTYILTEKINTLGNPDFTLENRQSFKTFYEDETVICFDGIERSKADIWLKSPKRRKYHGIIFDPTTTEHKNGYFNLWRGFARQPKQGMTEKYWWHVEYIICNGDKEIYEYLRKWLAMVFQYPTKVHTAIVLRGPQGTGKNTFVNPLGTLLGSHYAPLSSISELVSNFNYHLKHAVLIHANEALWGGNKKELGTVKAMITEETCVIEGKGKDRIVVPNFKHIILSSNEDWPVSLDPDDRRFLVLEVSDKHKEDLAYFQAIKRELDNSGLEALLYDLLNEDLTGFDPRKLPSKSDAFPIKMRSAESTHRYLYDVLIQGGFSIGDTDANTVPVWQGPIPKDNIYEDYSNWCEKSGEEANKQSKELFCRVIKKMIRSVEDSRPSGEKRVRCFKFPSLRQARQEFAQSFKEKPESIFDMDELG